MREGERVLPPPPKKCQSEGPGLTFPNVKNDAGASTKALCWGPGLTFQNVKNDTGKHKSTKKNQCFFLGAFKKKTGRRVQIG